MSLKQPSRTYSMSEYCPEKNWEVGSGLKDLFCNVKHGRIAFFLPAFFSKETSAVYMNILNPIRIVPFHSKTVSIPNLVKYFYFEKRFDISLISSGSKLPTLCTLIFLVNLFGRRAIFIFVFIKSFSSSYRS